MSYQTPPQGHQGFLPTTPISTPMTPEAFTVSVQSRSGDEAPRIIQMAPRRLFQDSPISSPELISSPSLFELSYQTLLSQLYGFPIEVPSELPVYGVPQLKAEFISFDQVQQKLQTQQINRVSVDPIYQPWAQSPLSSDNLRILTLIGNDGKVYLSKVRYDPGLNQINSPN